MSLVEWRFSKVNGDFGHSIWAFFNSLGYSVTCLGMFWKVAFLEILRNSLLTGGLQSTDSNATKGQI